MLRWFGDRFNMKRLLEDEKGQGMTEYIIIVAIIAVAAIAIMTFFGDAIKARFAYVVAVITGQSTTSAENTMKTKSTGANTEAGQSSKKSANF